MWPEEVPSLDDTALSDAPDSGRLGDEGDDPSTALAEAAAVGDGGSPAAKRDGDVSEEGLGAGGGLREEWEMMMSDEKVRISVQRSSHSFAFCMRNITVVCGLEIRGTSVRVSRRLRRHVSRLM